MKYYALDGRGLSLTESLDLKELKKRVKSLYSDNLPVTIIDENNNIVGVVTGAKRSQSQSTEPFLQHRIFDR
jgi:hypothetical protein